MKEKFKFSGEGSDVFMQVDPYDWHMTATVSLKEAENLCKKAVDRKRDQDLVLQKEKAFDGQSAYQLLVRLLGDTTLTIEDSVAAGNCASGTEKFIASWGLDKEMSATAILGHPKFTEFSQNPQFMRVIKKKLLEG